MMKHGYVFGSLKLNEYNGMSKFVTKHRAYSFELGMNSQKKTTKKFKTVWLDFKILDDNTHAIENYNH